MLELQEEPILWYRAALSPLLIDSRYIIHKKKYNPDKDDEELAIDIDLFNLGPYYKALQKNGV